MTTLFLNLSFFFLRLVIIAKNSYVKIQFQNFSILPTESQLAKLISFQKGNVIGWGISNLFQDQPSLTGVCIHLEFGKIERKKYTLLEGGTAGHFFLILIGKQQSLVLIAEIVLSFCSPVKYGLVTWSQCDILNNCLPREKSHVLGGYSLASRH